MITTFAGPGSIIGNTSSGRWSIIGTILFLALPVVLLGIDIWDPPKLLLIVLAIAILIGMFIILWLQLKVWPDSWLFFSVLGWLGAPFAFFTMVIMLGPRIWYSPDPIYRGFLYCVAFLLVLGMLVKLDKQVQSRAFVWMLFVSRVPW